MSVLLPVSPVLAHCPECSRHSIPDEKLHGSNCFQRMKAYSFIHVAVISGALPMSNMVALVMYTSLQVSRPVVRI